MTGGHPLTYKGDKGVVHMTNYEAIMIMLTFGLFIIALLSYINRK